MFTTGQLIFAICSIIAFAFAMFLAYKKDTKHQKTYYKDVWKIGLTIIIVIAIFAALTFWLHE